MQRIAIAVPCFDEARRLPVQRFREFLAEEKAIDLVFVDDGSRDGTERVLESVRAGQEERVQVLRLPRNQGKAEAVRCGILRALESRPAQVGFWDADLATPLDALPRLARVLEEEPRFEMVFGSRVQLLGRRVERNPWRHYAGRIFATAVSRLLAMPIYDTQCGAKLFRVTPDLPRLFAEPFETRWLFDVEIVARLAALRRAEGGPSPQAVIYEYPLETWVDVAGSKVRLRDVLGAAAGLYRIRRRYR